MKGIDVAKWNGVINWKKVKGAGVEFAILKAINKQSRVEDAFERNYAGAKAQGLPMSVYNYSYATTVTKAIQDANTVLAVIKGKNIDCVWLDVEDKCQQNLGMTLIDLINAYREIIHRAGYKFGVYTGLSFYNTYLKPYHRFLDCSFWIARYPVSKIIYLSERPMENKEPNILHNLWGWQYSSNGRIDGINGAVDLNIAYGGYGSKISAERKETGIVEYSVKADGDRSISENFKVREFACKDGSDKILIDADFVRDKLQAIRDYFGAAVTINSGYRTVAYNKKVGGAASSYHTKGQAFDIVVKGRTPAQVAKYAQSLGIKGIIQYNTFVHVDSRAEKYWARDNGTAVKVNSF